MLTLLRDLHSAAKEFSQSKFDFIVYLSNTDSKENIPENYRMTDIENHKTSHGSHSGRLQIQVCVQTFPVSKQADV